MAPKEKSKEKQDSKEFKNHLSEISEILAWFDSQEELDVEQALEKIKKAAVLIKESKKRLGEIENEFKEIKAEIEEDPTPSSQLL